MPGDTHAQSSGRGLGDNGFNILPLYTGREYSQTLAQPSEDQDKRVFLQRCVTFHTAVWGQARERKSQKTSKKATAFGILALSKAASVNLPIHLLQGAV